VRRRCVMGTGMLDREIGAGVGPGIPTASERQRARKWLQTRRDFGSHVVAFVVINAFLVGAWAFTRPPTWPGARRPDCRCCPASS